MKSKLCILLTDGTRALVVQRQDRLLTLPNETLWPAGLRPRRQNWPLAILMHTCYSSYSKARSKEWPPIVKQKRAFGLSADTSWYACSVDPSFLDLLVANAKTSKLWWFRYADAKPPWTLKIVKLDDFKDQCDAQSAHCALAFLHK